jgi:hypothetical protein
VLGIPEKRVTKRRANFALNAANGACTKTAGPLASPGVVIPLLLAAAVIPLLLAAAVGGARSVARRVAKLAHCDVLVVARQRPATPHA